ncbi:MAG: hypothetical protein K8T20_13405 [Planctomycetes bacterium]|nr:hypothetical protein [Planctomycetota bacterium]
MRLFAICVLLASAAAADPVTLKLKLPKGQSMKVDQTLALTSTANPAHRVKSPGFSSVTAVIVQSPFLLIEKWSDACVEDKGGDPVEVRRTILASKISTAKAASAPTSQEGCIFLLSKGDKGSTVKTERGKPEDLSVTLLGKGPPELVQVMLPAGAVNVGDTWKVDGSCNSPLQYTVSAGKAGAQGTARNALREDIDRMDDKKSPIGVGNATSAGCEVTATLKSVNAGIATIEFSGQQDIDSSKVPDAPDDAMIPKSKTVITGSMTFDIEAGRPIKVTWSSKHVVDDLEKRGTKFPGFTEEWAFTRTYAK